MVKVGREMARRAQPIAKNDNPRPQHHLHAIAPAARPHRRLIICLDGPCRLATVPRLSSLRRVRSNTGPRSDVLTIAKL